MSETDEKRRVRSGRPRDKSIDERLMWGALECYAKNGWSGFTFESVSRETGVGKPSIYLRWDSREELLEAAFEKMSRQFIAPDLGSVRADLLAWGAVLFAWWDSPVGLTFSRLQIESRYHPELLRPYLDLVGKPLSAAARQVMYRAMERGEVPRTANVSLLLEVMNGAIYTRATTGTPQSRPDNPVARELFVQRLVELVLTGTEMDLTEDAH